MMIRTGATQLSNIPDIFWKSDFEREKEYLPSKNRKAKKALNDFTTLCMASIVPQMIKLAPAEVFSSIAFELSWWRTQVFS